jgi:hypothetical protein
MSGGVALRVLLAALPFLSGCATLDAPDPASPTPVVEIVEDPVPLEWSSVITPEDQERLASIDDAWRQGLAARSCLIPVSHCPARRRAPAPISAAW